MEYANLKEQLSKILDGDVQNRQSLQEFRRSVFLKSEVTKNQDQLILEKSNELDLLNDNLKKIESDSLIKSTEIDDLKEQLNAQLLAFKTKEIELLELIDGFKTEIETLNASLSLEKQKTESISNFELKEIELLNEINDLKTELEDLKTSFEKKAEISELGENQQELIANNAFLNTQLDEIRFERDVLKEENQNLIQEKENWIKSESVLLESIHEHKNTFETFNRKINELTSEQEIWVTQKNDFETIQDELKVEINKLNLENKELKDKTQNLQNTLLDFNIISIQNSDYASKIRELIYHIDQQNEQQAQLINQLTELEKDKNRYETTLSNLKKEKLDQQDVFRVEHELMQKDNAQLVAQLELIHYEIEELKRENETLRLQVIKSEELLKDLEQKENEILNLKKEGIELDELKLYNELLSDENITLKSTSKSISLEYENLLTDFEKIKKEHEDLLDEHVGISEIRNELFSLNETLVEKNAIIAELTKQKKHLEELILNYDSSDLTTKNNESPVIDLNHEIEILNEDILKLKEHIKLLSQEFDFEKSNLNLQISDLQFQLKEKSNHSVTNSDDAFIDKLFKQIDLLNNENAVLSTEHEQVTDLLKSLINNYSKLFQVIENQKNEIINLEERNKQIKLATALEINLEENSDLKRKIVELVQEINNCIALLGD